MYIKPKGNTIIIQNIRGKDFLIFLYFVNTLVFI